MPQQLVVFHGGCKDGFCAAWVAWRHGWKAAEFFAGFYGQTPPDVAGRDVLMVDFSYPREQMKVLALRARSLQVYEHHKTAPEALQDLDPKTVVFDNERSGAGIAWDELADPWPRPWLVNYVEDRDLWRNKLPSTTVVNAYISTLEFDFNVWENELRTCMVASAIERGLVAQAKLKQYVREVAKNAMLVMFEGYEIPCVNVPQVDISEVLDALLKHRGLEFPIAMGWWQRDDGMYIYSLRSRGDVDVSALAKRYEGGGHHNAAGFQLQQPLELTRNPWE